MNQITQLSVVKSFSKKSVLITGVTGFLGKSILEKLLRETPDVGKIYILIRPSLKFSAQQRCEQEVFQSQLFDVLKCKFKASFDDYLATKVEVIAGDMTNHRYGLNDEAFCHLANKVDLIINSAASVDFREPMDQALNINTLSLNNILALCNEKSGDLPATNVVHISTCYVNGFNQGMVQEEVLSSASGLISPLDDETYDIQPVISRLMGQIDKIYASTDQKKSQNQKLIKLGIKQSQKYGWNDTYTFTKWLGEQLLIQGLNKQNLSIIRPSIIESAISSPIAGWVEGVKVADALIYAYAKGRVSIFPGDDEGILDVIPVDLVSNSVLMGAAELIAKPDQYRIYQCCSGRLNPIRLRQFIAFTQQASMEQYQNLPRLFAAKPQSKFNTVTPKKFRLYMYGLKTMTWIKTIKGRMLGSEKANALMEKANTTVSLATIFGFYTAPKYRFDNRKLEGLQSQFSAIEQAQFNARADCYDWKHYLQNVHLPGLHQYALAGKPAAIDGRQKKQKSAA